MGFRCCRPSRSCHFCRHRFHLARRPYWRRRNVWTSSDLALEVGRLVAVAGVRVVDKIPRAHGQVGDSKGTDDVLLAGDHASVETVRLIGTVKCIRVCTNNNLYFPIWCRINTHHLRTHTYTLTRISPECTSKVTYFENADEG